MERIVLRDRRALDDVLIFEQPVDVDSHLDLPALFAHQLLHPLAGRIIEVLSVYGGLCINGLRAIDPHAVAVVPLETS